MKKIQIILYSVVLLFFGCEKKYDGVINPENTNFIIDEIPVINNFTYSPADSLLKIKVTFSNNSNINDIKSVYVNIFAPDGNQINISQIYLVNSPNNKYTFENNYPLSENNISGKYIIEYYIIDKFDIITKCSIQNFIYDNGKSNIAPIISELSILPDSLVVVDTSIIKISLKAVDENGAADIEEVYFNVVKPDGTTSSGVTDLFDDGVAEHGDLAPSDSIYSRVISVYSTNMKGTYIFKFAARDRGKKVSNIISHNVIIK